MITLLLIIIIILTCKTGNIRPRYSSGFPSSNVFSDTFENYRIYIIIYYTKPIKPASQTLTVSL